MSDEENTIQHVSDTALWVAYFRAQESERPDALFHDPFAKVLVGERGRKIAESMKWVSKYTAWNLVMRTYIIDRFIERLIGEGVEVVLNLGAGLDTRPLRMNLPSTLQWIEIDFPQMIEYKEKKLATEKSSCSLERIALDLTERESRKKVFANITSRSKKVAVLTEGVIPYLTEAQVSELAEDLSAHREFQYWIAEYLSPTVYPYLKNPRRMKKMKNAPFSFYPSDWFGFFKNSGWVPHEIVYLGEESKKLKRKIPAPCWFSLLRPLMSKMKIQEGSRYSGYVIFCRG